MQASVYWSKGRDGWLVEVGVLDAQRVHDHFELLVLVKFKADFDTWRPLDTDPLTIVLLRQKGRVHCVASQVERDALFLFNLFIRRARRRGENGAAVFVKVDYLKLVLWTRRGQHDTLLRDSLGTWPRSDAIAQQMDRGGAAGQALVRRLAVIHQCKQGNTSPRLVSKKGHK